MADGEIMAVGFILAIFGVMTLISPIFDNVIFMFVKTISLESLQILSVMCLFGGIAIAIIGARTNRERRR